MEDEVKTEEPAPKKAKVVEVENEGDQPSTSAKAKSEEKIVEETEDSDENQTTDPPIPNIDEIDQAIDVRNVVATAFVGSELDLATINSHLHTSEYRPSKYSGLIVRLLAPRCTLNLFRSGKIICFGTHSVEEANLAFRNMDRILQRLGYEVSFSGFTCNNIMAKLNVGFIINLDSLFCQHSQYAIYEPQLFPALIYQIAQPRMKVLIYVHGKIMFDGAKSREDISECLRIIYPIILKFKK